MENILHSYLTAPVLIDCGKYLRMELRHPALCKSGGGVIGHGIQWTVSGFSSLRTYPCLTLETPERVFSVVSKNTELMLSGRPLFKQGRVNKLQITSFLQVANIHHEILAFLF